MITIKYSEAMGAIFAESIHERRNVTDEIIKAMEEAGWLSEGGRWEIHPERDDIIACSVCEVKYTRASIEAVAVWGQKLPRCCPNCGARLTGESEDAPKKYFEKFEAYNIPDNTVDARKMADAREKWIDYGNFIRQTEERLTEYAERLERLKEGGDGASD